MTSQARRQLCAALLAALGAGSGLPLQAQTKFPEKTLTFIVPFAAGSATDQLARALGQSITDQTKQPVVIDNKAGASGAIAAQAAAKAAPDGYTVLITTNTTHAANGSSSCRRPTSCTCRTRAIRTRSPICSAARST